jgi:hypothetical protein
LRIARRIMPAPQELKALKLLVRKYKYSGASGIQGISDIAAALGLAQRLCKH